MAFPPDMKPPEKPADDKKPGAPKLDVNVVVADAEQAGKLTPITDALKAMGRDDIDAKEVLKLAQKDDRTHGKPVEEIAKMLSEDEGLLDDLIEYKDGGQFASRGMGMKPGHDEAKEGEPPAGGGAMPPGNGKTTEDMLS